TYAPDDESGDAYRFTREIAALSAARGVSFRYGATAEALLTGAHDGISGIRARCAEGAEEILVADGYVVCLGVRSAPLLRPLGIDLRIHPVKGYSVTLPVLDPRKAYTVSLTTTNTSWCFRAWGIACALPGPPSLRATIRR
ncbi:MAG: FAD-dependent oxidoreductase, partial [Burkholderiales bacterium]